jgi:hypothetical protein
VRPIQDGMHWEHKDFPFYTSFRSTKVLKNLHVNEYKPKLSPEHPVLKHPKFMFFLNIRDKVSYSYKREITLQFCIINLQVADGKINDRELNGKKHL